MHASGTDELKIALIGCGGRGSGACGQALSTYHKARSNSLPWPTSMRTASRVRSAICKNHQAPASTCRRSASSSASTPLQEAIDARRPGDPRHAARLPPDPFRGRGQAGQEHLHGKAGRDRCRRRAPSVLAAAEEAKKKNLKVGVGLQRHHQAGYIETIKRLQTAQIGDIVSMRGYWNGDAPVEKTRADLEAACRSHSSTEMEYQMRNWYYFTWLCGDHIVEQHIHNLDVINWVKNGHPVKASGMGGPRDPQRPGRRRNLRSLRLLSSNTPTARSASASAATSLSCWNSVSEACRRHQGHERRRRNRLRSFGDEAVAPGSTKAPNRSVPSGARRSVRRDPQQQATTTKPNTAPTAR